jgi:hypothetical protein
VLPEITPSIGFEPALASLPLLVMQGRLRATVSDGTTGYVPR